MHTPPSCCPGLPARSRSRAFFQAAVTLALIAGGLSGSLGTQAQAADYTNPLGNVENGSIQFHGGSLGTFSNFGTIDASSNNANSVAFYNAQIILNFVNSGIIACTNSGGISMFSGAGTGWYEIPSRIDSFTNSGSISGTYYGINLGNNGDSIGQFTNTGLISSPGSAIDVSSGPNTIQSINNSGTISGSASAISNSGTITTITNSSSGTISGVSNYGTITTLTNFGTIGTITNSGTIGTLTVLSGAQFSGGILNSGTIGTLNVAVVPTSANFEVMGGSAPVITGNQPGTINQTFLAPKNSAFVTVGGRTVGVDTSAFGANANAIRHISNSVGRLANTNGVIQSIGAKIAKHNADPYAMTSDLCADGAPAQPGQIGNSDFWIRGFMGRNRVDATSSSVDYINTYSGGAVGIERDWSENTRAGAFIGAGITDNSLGGGLGGSEADLLFAGAYATKTWGTLFAKVGLTSGRGNNTNTRNIAAATPEIALADFNSWYVSPEVSIGKVYDLGQRLGGTFSVTPVLSVRYVYAHQDGYTETGATNNLTMNNSHSTTIEERAELKFSYATKAFNDYGVKINASVGGIGQQNSGGAMSGTLLGAPLSFATPGDDNTTGFVGGIGFEINRGKYTFTASGDYVRLSGGNADLSANVVFSVKF